MKLSKKNLHSYQQRAIDFIRQKKKCALFLDLGLGKTVSSATAITELLEDFYITKCLIIAPLDVCNEVWLQEFEKWEQFNDIRASLCTGSAKERKAALNKEADIYIINRENVVWLLKNHPWTFDAVIVDESSSFKSHSSQRFKALSAAYDKINVMVLLTGTPAPNGYHDLWSQIFLIDRGKRLGKNITAYRNRWFTRHFKGFGFIQREEAANEIEQKIEDVCLSMKAEDYLELPPRIDINESVVLPAGVQTTYDELKTQFVAEIEDKEVAVLGGGSLSNKLMQICNGHIYDEDGESHKLHDAKINRLKQIIEDNPNENILLAYNYKSDKEAILKAFPHAKQIEKKGNTVKRWNQGKIPLLIAHPASAGYGLNLQGGGSIIVWYGLNWSLELYQQFNGRLHRQGQGKPVRVIHLVAKGCIDEDVLYAIRMKAKNQEQLLQYLKERITNA